MGIVDQIEITLAIRLKWGIISSRWSRNLSAPYAQDIKITSKRANSNKFHDGADSLNKVNIWIPPGQVNVRPNSAMQAAVIITTIGRINKCLV